MNGHVSIETTQQPALQIKCSSLNQLIVNRPSCSPLCLPLESVPNFDALVQCLSEGFGNSKGGTEYPPEYLEGLRIVGSNKEIQSEEEYGEYLKRNGGFNFAVLDVKFRCVGGKGGFGSLLRSSKSTKRTTNFGSCRDIHGRRLRDTDKERLLNELKHQQELRDHERAEAERARARERRLQMDAGMAEVKKTEEEIQDKRKKAVEHINSSVQKAILKKKEEEKKRKRDPESEPDKLSESDSESEKPKQKKRRVEGPQETPDQFEQKEPTDSSPSPLLAPQDPPLPDLDLNSFSSISDLEKIGPKTIKQTLTRMGLKCGGTPKDRLNRLWAVKGLSPSMIPSKFKAKPTKK